MVELPFITVAEAGRLIARRELSAVQLLESCLARIEALDLSVRAFLTLTIERAFDQARQADAEISAGHCRGPLHGVPFGLKDIFNTAGIRTTAHSRLCIDNVPSTDATTARRLQNAGAVLVGKLATHEFARSGPSFDLPWPPARNPWNLAHIPGGSSSGSAAAVAAGFVPFALGSDTGGSIRSPAAFCGIVGLRPTYGRVSRHGVMPNSYSFDACGPMTRSVEDCALVLDAIAGHDPSDPASAAHPVPNHSAALTGDIQGVRIGLIRDFWEAEQAAVPEVRQAMDEAIEVFRGLGAVVREERLRPLDDYCAVKTVIGESEVYAIHRPNLTSRLSEFGIDFQKRILAGVLVTGADYVQAQRARRRLVADVRPVFEQCDVLLAATTAKPARAFSSPAPPLSWTLPTVTPVASVLGLPALSLCNGFSECGLPLGMQVVGRPFDEMMVLRIAYAYERATSWYERRPSLDTAAAEIADPPRELTTPAANVDAVTVKRVDAALQAAGLIPSNAVRSAIYDAAPRVLETVRKLYTDVACEDEPAPTFSVPPIQ